MNVTIEEIDGVKRKLIVEIPEERARTAWRKLLDAYAKKARLKGFRPGKAPRDMVAKAYAEELRRETIEEMVSETVPEALKERELNPLGRPMLEDVSYEGDLPSKFSVFFEVKPVFETPQWRGLALQRRRSRVDDELTDKKLEELRHSLATITTVKEDRPLAKDDLASLSYRAFSEEGAELPQFDAAVPFTLDLEEAGGPMPALVGGLVGMKAGETREIRVVLPEDAAKMAGRPLKLMTSLKEIKTRELPELDDEFAKDLGLEGVETLAALKERLRRDLLKEEAERNDRLLNQQLTKILSDLVSFDKPSVMVEAEIDKRLQTLRDNLARNGIDFKKIDTARLRERFRAQAEKGVAAALTLDQIGRENQVTVSDEDIEAELAELGREYGRPAAALREYYQSHGLMETMREGLRISRTMDLIKAQAVIEEVETLDPLRMGFDLPAQESGEEAAAGEAGTGETETAGEAEPSAEPTGT